jgi:hypothetical protein
MNELDETLIGCTKKPGKRGRGARYKSAVEIFPDAHRVIARVKTCIPGTHSHVSNNHLNHYLSEFSDRFNRRFKQRPLTILDSSVTICCVTHTITYKQLVAGLSGRQYFILKGPFMHLYVFRELY